MNFRPMRWKVIVSLVVIGVYYILLQRGPYGCPLLNCYMPPTMCNPEISEFHLYPQCWDCRCPKETTVLEIIVQIVTLIFPGILVYVIWSLIQGKKEEKKDEVEKVVKFAKNRKKG